MWTFYYSYSHVSCCCTILTCHFLKDSSKILEICGQVILEKCNPLKQLPADWLDKQVDTKCSPEGIPYGGLVSSAASCQDDVVFYDEGTKGLVIVLIRT